VERKAGKNQDFAGVKSKKNTRKFLGVQEKNATPQSQNVGSVLGGEARWRKFRSEKKDLFGLPPGKKGVSKRFVGNERSVPKAVRGEKL